MAKPIKKGKQILRPRARIIRTIGQELISNDTVAIVELVKNSYDANARKVEIIFNEPLVKGSGQIVIKDNGDGMTLNTVKKGWMEPATIIKTIRKKRGKGRKLLGEKGIGRFASAKLSKKLEMYTRIENKNEIAVRFNWDDFSNKKKYLDEINCEWEVRKPEIIEKKGTVLILKDLNLSWDEEKLRDLRNSLSRLINPFDKIKNFEIELILPKKHEKLSGPVDFPKSLNKPDYNIVGSANKNGEVNFIYSSKKNNKPEEKNIQINLKPAHMPQCGPFNFELRVWDREQSSLNVLANEIGSTVKDVKRDLNEAGGISIYRDGFRVLPYGEEKNDWLRLDIRRVNNPTLRLSNNQVIGYVSISLEMNPELVDQSNREGIVESIAFDDFKECILFILNEIENRRYSERPREENEQPITQGIFSKMSIGPVIEMVNKKLPDDKEAQKVVLAADTAIKEGVKQVQIVLSRYRRLSTLGLLLDVVLHDGNNILLKLDTEISLLDKEFNKETVSHEQVKTHIHNVKQERHVMSELFKRLEPFGGRKRGKPENIILENAIKNVFELYKSELEKYKIQVIIPESKTEIVFDQAELEMIFVNLMLNSIYWLDDIKQKDRKIAVEITKQDEVLNIIFSDNGPGVAEEYRDKIFNPYFSTKPDGIGLGLTHVGELITENNGIFELINGGPLNGANFRISFRGTN